MGSDKINPSVLKLWSSNLDRTYVVQRHCHSIGMCKLIEFSLIQIWDDSD